MDRNKKQIINLSIFAFVVIFSGWAGVILNNIMGERQNEGSLGSGLWLISACLAGIIIRIVNRDWKDFGVLPHFKDNLKWYLFAILVYPVITLIVTGLGLVTGTCSVSEFDINKLTPIFLSSLVGIFIIKIFEEYSWRGFLTPKLIELNLKDWQIYVLVGIIWTLWHGAYYLVLLPDNTFEGTSRLGMFLSGFIIMGIWGVMYTEVYRLTKSVLPCLIMHVVEDELFMILPSQKAISFDNIGKIFFDLNSGIVTVVLFLMIGLILRQVRIKKEIAQTRSHY